MSGAREAQLAHLLALSPPGGAYPRARDSNWARALAPLAGEQARIEAEAEAMLIEVDPRRAQPLLADYERVLGDDPCLGPSAELPLGIRQQLAHQRWTNRGGATPAFFVALAAAVDVTITITESEAFEAGVATAGMELVPEAGRFEWVVSLPAPTVLIEFETGAADAGTPLGDFAPNPVECLIRAAAPAHTAVYFNYQGS
jgi:uncharacterized protein YmfQ (DUF2313 family)